VKEQFTKLLIDLDEWLQDENIRRIKEGEAGLKSIEMKLMGQFALLVALPHEDLNSTSDLDAIIRGDRSVIQFLKERLLEHHLVLDDDAELIRMPKGTQWNLFYKGKFLSVFVAAPEYVIASKCQFKRVKDKAQIQKLLKKFPKWKNIIRSLSISMEWLDEK
jgi:hypothetical protein